MPDTQIKSRLDSFSFVSRVCEPLSFTTHRHKWLGHNRFSAVRARRIALPIDNGRRHTSMIIIYFPAHGTDTRRENTFANLFNYLLHQPKCRNPNRMVLFSSISEQITNGHEQEVRASIGFSICIRFSWVLFVHSTDKSILLDYNYWSHSSSLRRRDKNHDDEAANVRQHRAHHLILVSVLPLWFAILFVSISLHWNELNKIILTLMPFARMKGQ